MPAPSMENQPPDKSAPPSQSGTPGCSILLRILAGTVGLGVLAIFIIEAVNTGEVWANLWRIVLGIGFLAFVFGYALKGEKGGARAARAFMGVNVKPDDKK